MVVILRWNEHFTFWFVCLQFILILILMSVQTKMEFINPLHNCRSHSHTHTHIAQSYAKRCKLLAPATPTSHTTTNRNIHTCGIYNCYANRIALCKYLPWFLVRFCSTPPPPPSPPSATTNGCVTFNSMSVNSLACCCSPNKPHLPRSLYIDHSTSPTTALIHSAGIAHWLPIKIKSKSKTEKENTKSMTKRKEQKQTKVSGLKRSSCTAKWLSECA